jgi:nucleoid-associated protein YgaU
MGCVEQAVREFDEEVQAPWRPLLVSVPDIADPPPAVLRRPGHRSPSRVGACRPPASGVRPPAGPERIAPGRGRAARVRSRPRVRLTRRARRLVLVLALFGAVALGSLLGSLVSGGSGEALNLVGVSNVVVQPGDTLWSIAGSVADGNDIRVVVDSIQELNGLEGSEIVPGQVLQVP